MCCDSCPKSFHFICANPPLDPQNLPEGRWECRACTGKKTLAEADKTKDSLFTSKLFGPLFRKLEVMNPVQFKIPKDIRRSFVGYARHPETGDYMDLTENELTKNVKIPNPDVLESTSAICFKCCKFGSMVGSNSFALFFGVPNI